MSQSVNNIYLLYIISYIQNVHSLTLVHYIVNQPFCSAVGILHCSLYSLYHTLLNSLTRRILECTLHQTLNGGQTDQTFLSLQFGLHVSHVQNEAMSENDWNRDHLKWFWVNYTFYYTLYKLNPN